MKKVFLFLSLFLIPFKTFSKDCFLFEIKGTFHFEKHEAILYVQEGTRSEQKFKLKIEDIYKAAPYKNSTSKGHYFLEKTPQYGDNNILSVLKIERDFPDPLRSKNHSYVKELGKKECPK
ncbi:MAG: hypothetical protein AB7R69_05835 [Candidatus Babeliales bacterium]